MKDKFLRINEKLINNLKSNLDDLFYEHPDNRELILDTFFIFLRTAKIDPRIIVDVLENFSSDERALDIILEIKITEGWHYNI